MSSKVEKLREAWESKRQNTLQVSHSPDFVKYPFNKELFGTERHEDKNRSEVNSLGFRSDEFKKDHNGMHIVFTGCSTTYGTGLKLEDTWANKVYKELSKTKEVSGYYNLAVRGSGLFFIVSNLFKYFKKYGNPDLVFIGLPDMLRSYAVSSPDFPIESFYKIELLFEAIKDKVHHKIGDSKPPTTEDIAMWTNYYDYLIMLEGYCKTNNIDLFIFSYNPPTDAVMSRTDIESFFSISPAEVAQEVVDFISNNDVDKYFVTAEDGQHEGHGFHSIWASKVLKLYLRGKDVN